MLFLENCHKDNNRVGKFPLLLYLSLVFIFLEFSVKAQTCPANIDFETGTFDGWTCYVGETDAVGSQNVITLYSPGGPVSGRHTMYGPNSNEVDYFGGFPVHCPNGSGHSVKLGSTAAGGQAEGISYEFTIPANQNSYSITYYYAVVFQAPDHQENEQPRMEIEITNVTDNTVISCASFTFIAVGTSIPGFEISNQSANAEVLYKRWSAVSVDLSGNAGKRIRLFFKTADCTFRRHFGYAYVDVNTECNSNLVGATYCPDDTLVKIVAPYGYQEYAWYDSSTTNLLSTEQTLIVSPPPVSGTTYAVKLEPYAGYGCPKTLYSRVIDSLTVIADAGRDALSCNGDTIQIGTIPKEGLVYLWSPAAGLSDPNIANPTVDQGITAKYVVTTSNSGGGCRNSDTVQVTSSIINNSLQVIGKDAYCFGHGDSAVLRVKPAHKVEWFKDDVPINTNANQTSYRVNAAGTYFAALTDELGCTITTDKQPIIIDHDRPGVTYPIKYAIANFPLTLSARPIGETVLWSPALNLNAPESFTPSFRGTLEQQYNIEIKSRGGCVTVDTQLVKVVDRVEIYMPTAFTPNRDGKNDYLHPIFKGVAEVRMFRIYNRAGQLLFESKSEQPGWDGSFKGAEQQPQTVVWMVECIGLDGLVYLKKGASVLIR